MKKKILLMCSVFILLIVIIVLILIVIKRDNRMDKRKTQLIVTSNDEIKAEVLMKKRPVIVYDGLTLEELGIKLENVMNSSLEGKGYMFASYALEMNVDPYIALAIVFQETGCYYGNCSSMVRNCNNIGGMKGGTVKCFNGSYASFSSIDEGITTFINNLAYGYFNQGLNTPELINNKYASDTSWAHKVNNYIEMIKNS